LDAHTLKDEDRSDFRDGNRYQRDSDQIEGEGSISDDDDRISGDAIRTVDRFSECSCSMRYATSVTRRDFISGHAEMLMQTSGCKTDTFLMHDYIDSAFMSRLAILNYCNLLDLQLLRQWNLQYHVDFHPKIRHILRLIAADACFHRLDAGVPMLRGIALRGIGIGEARNPGPPYENGLHASEIVADCHSQDAAFADCHFQDADLSDAALARIAAD
jgi:hypothetical protein